MSDRRVAPSGTPRVYFFFSPQHKLFWLDCLLEFQLGLGMWPKISVATAFAGTTSLPLCLKPFKQNGLRAAAVLAAHR